MNRLLVALVIILVFPLSTFSRAHDSVIARKCYNDTSGFKPFTNYSILDSISPKKSFVKWEYNRAGDSIVLAKPPIKDGRYLGFMRVMAPAIYTYYISAQKRNGKIKTFYNINGISNFIGKINNQNDAYFWLFFIKGNVISFYPTTASYKILEDGVLICLKRAISTDYTIENYTPPKYIDTYFVGFDKDVVLVKTEHTPGFYTERKLNPIAIISSEVVNYNFEENDHSSDAQQYIYPCLFNNEKDLLKYIDSRARYPDALLEDNVVGKVYACFIIQPDGVVTDIEILQSLNPLIDEELIRVLKLMPKWSTNGHVDDKTVAVKVSICVEFKLL